jgi:emfourin
VKIDFVRTGGFAGMRLELHLDTRTLREERALEMERLVKSAGFFDLPMPGRRPAQGADLFEYRVEIESEELGSRTITVSETAVPDRLQPLIEHLSALAMDRRRPSGATEADGV